MDAAYLAIRRQRNRLAAGLVMKGTKRKQRTTAPSAARSKDHSQTPTRERQRQDVGRHNKKKKSPAAAAAEDRWVEDADADDDTR